MVEGAVAVVNDQAISQTDVRNRMRLILMSFPGQRTDDIIREAQARATEALIEEKLELQEFKKMLKDAKVEPQEIQDRLDELAKQNNIPTNQFLSGLQQAGVNVQTLKDQVEAEIAWGNLVSARYYRQVRVSDQRIDEYLERLKENAEKEQFRLAEIFLYAPDPESRKNALSRAGTLKTQIEGGADFSQVAQQFSASASASAGGDLSWMSLGDMKPEIKAAVTNAKAGSVLPPIETDTGVYLIAVLGRREPVDASTATMDLKQVMAKGDDAGPKIELLRTNAKSCAAVISEAAKAPGVTLNDMNGVVLTQVSEAYRAALTPLQVNQSTPVMDIPGGKMSLFVCKRQQGAPMPGRAQVRNQLANQELEMLGERYLRDIKRDATIIRR